VIGTPCRTAAPTVWAICSAVAGYATIWARPSGSCSWMIGERCDRGLAEQLAQLRGERLDARGIDLGERRHQCITIPPVTLIA
jgi:hypothetical protein